MTYGIIAVVVAAFCWGGVCCIRGGSDRSRGATVGFLVALAISVPVVFLLGFFRLYDHSIQMFGVAIGESLWLPAACGFLGAMAGFLRSKTKNENG